MEAAPSDRPTARSILLFNHVQILDGIRRPMEYILFIIQVTQLNTVRIRWKVRYQIHSGNVSDRPPSALVIWTSRLAYIDYQSTHSTDIFLKYIQYSQESHNWSMKNNRTSFLKLFSTEFNDLRVGEIETRISTKDKKYYI